MVDELAGEVVAVGNAGTKALLANGKTVPISSLKPGEKVLATNTKTGKNQAEIITAVLIHDDHDLYDLYDLKVRADGRTTVIDTTSNTCSGHRTPTAESKPPR